jgi:hypothetical protein
LPAVEHLPIQWVQQDDYDYRAWSADQHLPIKEQPMKNKYNEWTMLSERHAACKAHMALCTQHNTNLDSNHQAESAGSNSKATLGDLSCPNLQMSQNHTVNLQHPSSCLFTANLSAASQPAAAN